MAFLFINCRRIEFMFKNQVYANHCTTGSDFQSATTVENNYNTLGKIIHIRIQQLFILNNLINNYLCVTNK